MAAQGESCFSSLANETVEIILSFLPARSLVTALLVCHLWRELAQRILKGRKRWICRLFKCQDNGSHSIDNEAAKCTIQSQLYEFLDNMDTVPSAVILFTSGLLADNHSLKSFLTKTQEKLPVSCLVVGCDAGGVIGESSAGCLEEVEQNSPAMSVLLVPKINGVNVSLFSITRQEILDNKSNKQSWKKSFGIVVNQEIKFVLLIGQHDQQQMGKVVEGIKKVFGEHVVVIGGLAKPFTVLNGKVKSNGVVGLAIGGNVRANCLVHHGSTKQSLVDSFQKLSEDKRTDRGACFMVSCIGRGENFYSSKNVESSMFRKTFPTLTLFGFFGNGEIGINMPGNGEQTKKGASLKCFHTYSSVFSVLALLDEDGASRVT